MRTPSLRRRVTISGVAVFVVVVIALNAFVYLLLADRLGDSLDEVLATRAELAHELGELLEAEELAARLQSLGIPVVVTTAAGEVIEGEPAVPRFETGPPGRPVVAPQPRISTTVELRDGAVAEVFATRVGVEATLRGVLILMVIGTALALVLATLLLRRAAAVSMAPLEEVVDAARRTAAGHSGERLDPADPETELGRMAVAYDTMLDGLEDAVDQAHLAEERTRRFLADAAHQLRTPIAGIRSSVESLLREADPAARDQLMANLVREAARASRVLSSLLALARFDAGQLPERGPCDLRPLCRDEVERAQSLAPHLGIGLHEPATPVVALLDEPSVREALGNLLDNARRHASSCIDVSIEVEEETAVVRVVDDGEGVPEEEQERIFERFVTSDGLGGSGLGLAIGRATARSHGGDLAYDDGFVLRLPLPDDRRAT